MYDCSVDSINQQKEIIVNIYSHACTMQHVYNLYII